MSALPKNESKLRTPVPPRRLGRAGTANGPCLIVVGSLHGNEPPGVAALQRVLERLRKDPSLLEGSLVAFTGNRRALGCGRRFLSEDLNRMWTEERVERVRAHVDADNPEEVEMHELDQLIQAELARRPGAFMLDLHSTSGPGPPFTTIDDTLANRAFGFSIPVPHVLGLEEELPATLVGYLNGLGVTAVGFEAGQHDDPSSVDRAEAAVWIALEVCAVLRAGACPEVVKARRLLASDGTRAEAVEVCYRHAVEASDRFSMRAGYRSFQRIKRGEVLGTDVRGDVRSPMDGMILMPLYQEQGSDGFFVIRPVHPFWLWISARARRLRLHNVMHLLPGVSRQPDRPNTFLVDRKRARWLALQLFHLLGYRRRSKDAPMLEMVRRESF